MLWHMDRIGRVALTGAALVTAGFTSGGPLRTIDDTLIHESIPVTVGERLELKLETGGTVHITGSDQPMVTVEAKLRSDQCPDGKMTVTNVKGVVHVTSHLSARYNQSCSVPDAIEISVPRQFDVLIESEGGAVSIEQVSGQIRGHTNGGALTLARVGGTLDLTTLAGDVQLTDSNVDGSLKTGDGTVTFVHVAGKVRGKSSTGGADVKGEG